MKSRKVVLVVALTVATFIATRAHAQTVVYYFGQGGSTDPLDPEAAGIIVQGRDGNLYSTTPLGGYFGTGTIFEVTSPGGILTVPWSFGLVFDDDPYGGLTLGTDGYYYGTDTTGEINSEGTVFKVDPAFTEMTTLHVFNGTDGDDPLAPPIEGSDGNFYGTTSGMFVNNGGTIYKITSTGTFTLLHTFGAFGTTGGYGAYGPLVQGLDGNFYGTTLVGGTKNDGTVYRITSQGTLTILHSFVGTDGYEPTGDLVLGTDGNFYGTAGGGGSTGGGVAFKITSQGKLTVLASFTADVGLGFPVSSLMQGSDGNFYGTAQFGAYSMTPAGKISVVGVFDGEYLENPFVKPMQHTSGVIYGETSNGGDYEGGAFYELKLGLPPFAGLVPNTGKVGKSIGILGQGFTAATGVSFNGVAATTFKATSDTYMTAMVPSTATTGPVTVTIPSGNLVSKQSFLVTPTIASFSPPSGAVGTAVTIKGASLKQTTKVSFGGVAAPKFTVNSNAQITATVPTGAVTGKIVITTAGGAATSATAFTVTP
jgi:uncharacterized repeat protein (TIGR03803 family)